jgi:prolyl oligopeptidase
MDRARSCLLVASLILASKGTAAWAEDQQVSADPFSWLEELQGKRSREWVSAHTAATLAELTKAPEFPALFADIKRVLDSRETIAYPQIVGERLYNLEQDENHPRGLWRRSSWDNYLRGADAWESVLDLDSLARADRVAWNFVGAECLEPENRYCLLELDREGSDSTEIRGLDVEAGKFVRIEANLPLPKPRISRLARSEMPDIDTRRDAIRYPGHPGFEVRRRLLERAEPADGDVFMVLDQVIVYIHEPWTVGGKTWQAGSIIATSFGDFLTAKRNFTLVLKAGPREAIESVSATRDYLLVNVLNNVCGELRRYRHEKDRWAYEKVRVPKMGSVDVISTSTTMNRFFFTYTGFLQPTTLYLADDDGKVREVKRLPPTFSAADLTVEQSEATSKDGTRIPFFIVHRSSMQRDGSNPTLLYAYGGFAFSSAPAYGTAVGPAWIGRGGVYVVANIRGGGEFGSDWHIAGIMENRQRVYDDFTAVAEELIRQHVTSPEHLGIMGASNGGLLVGVAITERADLYKAAVVQSALLDMQRYTHLLGGAHWISEYGDPDKPDDWSYISRYSPYQNLRGDTKYPAVLFTTNMRDDRVHPAHARKMAAKMESMGAPVYYFENASGGHGSGLTSEEKARTLALAYTFLWQQLKGAR